MNQKLVFQKFIFLKLGFLFFSIFSLSFVFVSAEEPSTPEDLEFLWSGTGNVEEEEVTEKAALILKTISLSDFVLTDSEYLILEKTE